MHKFLKYILIALGFVIALSISSSVIDPDFSWHLLFGQHFWQAGIFPYADTATFTFFGQTWINHEWGTGIIFWLIYSRVGYFALLLIMSAAVWASFLFAQKLFHGKLNLTTLSVAVVSLFSIKQCGRRHQQLLCGA